MKDEFSAIWFKNVPRARKRAGEHPRDYRKRFRGAFRTWAKAMYADEVVLTNLLRFGFSGADTPAKLLGTAIHAHNEHAKQNRKDKKHNRITELQEHYARKVRRALRFGKITEKALTPYDNDMLRRLEAGELRIRKPEMEREDFATKLTRLQGHIFQ